MKICIISPTVVPILETGKKYGGIETVIYNVAKELTKRNHEVIVYASGDSEVAGRLIPLTKKALGQGISFDEEVRSNRQAYELAINENPDIIWDNTLALHAHDKISESSKYIFSSAIIFDSKKLIDTKNIPVIQTLHGPAKNHLPEIVQALSKAGHFFVSISKDQARRYLEFIKKGQHLGTVYNPINLNIYNVEPNKTADYLLWVGRYCMEKSPHIAILASKKINIPIYLIGKKKEKHEMEYYNKFIKPLLDDNVISLGQLSTEKTAKYYKNAKAVMMTNLWPEPFGLVVAEAMASGTPVLGPALGSLTELIDDAGILIKVDDLNISEDDKDVTESQWEYIDRIVERFPELDYIPPEIPRKRAEYLFSPKHAANGYEEAFFKALYLKKKIK